MKSTGSSKNIVAFNLLIFREKDDIIAVIRYPLDANLYLALSPKIKPFRDSRLAAKSFFNKLPKSTLVRKLSLYNHKP